MEEPCQEFLEYEDIEAYAKLEGPGYKQFITKPVVYLGRESNNITNEEQTIFIGDSQKISRQHAKIQWSSTKGEWEFTNLSKNKVIVNGTTFRKEESLRLPSCSAIKIDKYRFYFFPARKE
jgi:hypothetical protein